MKTEEVFIPLWENFIACICGQLIFENARPYFQNTIIRPKILVHYKLLDTYAKDLGLGL